MLVSLHYGRPRLTTIRHLYKTVNSSTAVENFFFHKKTLYVHFTPLQQHGLYSDRSTFEIYCSIYVKNKYDIRKLPRILIFKIRICRFCLISFSLNFEENLPTL